MTNEKNQPNQTPEGPPSPEIPTPKPEGGMSNYLTLLLAVLAAVIAGGLVWVYYNYYVIPDIENQSSQTQITIPEKESEESTSEDETVSDETANWQTYTNTKYGFTLTFPETWKGYEATEEKLDGSVITYFFWLPTGNQSYSLEKPGFASPFALTVFTINQWSQEQAQDGPKRTYINHNNQYYFGYSTAQDAPDDLVPLYNDINGIIDTFQFTE